MVPEPAPATRSRDSTRAEATRTPAGGSVDAVPAPPLDLNRASVEELDRLPGIGPVLARRIVEHRTRLGAFRSTDELLGVPGIGVRSLERLRPYVATPSR